MNQQYMTIIKKLLENNEKSISLISNFDLESSYIIGITYNNLVMSNL